MFKGAQDKHTGLKPSQSNLWISVTTWMPPVHLPVLMSQGPGRVSVAAAAPGNPQHVFPEQLGPPKSQQLPLQP